MIPYNPQGLTPEEVAASRAAHGENIITPQRDDSAWRLLAEKFRDPIIIVLLVVYTVEPAEPPHGVPLEEKSHAGGQQDGAEDADGFGEVAFHEGHGQRPVSYTHLTLPTT